MVRHVKLIALIIGLAGCGGSGPQEYAASEPILSTQSIPASMQGVEAKQLFGAKPQGS